jgi:uncharacterized protein YdhG (YjbR/CyaY superfamily)
MRKAKNVNEYIKEAPAEAQAKLIQLRKIIKATVPKAEEKISYGMPYYVYKGAVAYFAYAKSHVGLYIPPPVIAEHKAELKSYVTAKATVQLPLSKKLPIKLVQRLVRARVKKNEQKIKK